MKRARQLLTIALVTAASAGSGAGCGAGKEDAKAETPEQRGPIRVGVLLKNDTNPFFVDMQRAIDEAAERQGFEVVARLGTKDGDHESQVVALGELTAAGVDAILITPNDSRLIVPELATARRAGILTIALDTPVEPATGVDATFATDNSIAGQAIGAWARAKHGDARHLALLDLNDHQISVDVARDQGFLRGFGIPVGDPKVLGDEIDPRIAGRDVTDGSEAGGRRAMANILAFEPAVDLVYTINEPAARGARAVLRERGRGSVPIVSVDGGCEAMSDVANGRIQATSMQFPSRMAERGIEAIARWAKDGTKPAPPGPSGFTDTGVKLITDDRASGIKSESSTSGKTSCWG